MNRSRSIFAAALLSLAAFAPSLAGASSVPSYASLPEASLPDMLHPKDAPESITRSEGPALIHSERAFSSHTSHLMVTALEGRCVTLGAVPPGAVPSGAETAHFRGDHGSVPIRLEQLVTNDAGAASLEIDDGWLDLKTENVRIETTTRVPLARLAKGPTDEIAVYGFRSGGKLHVVLPSKRSLAYVDEGGGVGHAVCGHARLTLDPSSKGGSMILAAGRAILPDKLVAPRPTSKPQQMLHAQLQQRSTGERQRGFQVSVSTSRASRDKEPLLSVSVTWTEEEPPPNAQASNAGFEEEFPDHEVHLLD
ncbi:hypothetical protein [Polyangium aurulentum]|uniref:hypothetical protein n=1 Tax=Polyangium aurulentum TaxID=2567896 RepID=UPI0010AE1349|nr:hypothetical protein [Polyangium aurulentum]UQA59122.1 hypothetical protein E8A73_000975 [Polyangium aurulentum]